MKILSEIWNKSEVLASITVAISATFLLAGYEFLRSASFSLFKASYGVENLPFIIAMTPLGVLTVLWIYGKILTRFGPRKTLSITTLGVCFSILTCYVFIKFGFKPANAVFFILRECYAALLVEQFWSFINSILKESDAKKYNGLILGIATTGGIVGGLAVHRFVEALGTQQLVLIGGLFCIPCWYIAQVAYQISGREHSARLKSKTTHDNKVDTFGLSLFVEHRLLLVISGMILLSQFYSYFVGLNFQEVIHEQFVDLDRQTAFSGLFFAITNAASIFAQFFMTPFLLSRLSISTIHFIIPSVNLLCLSVFWLSPSLYTVSAAFLVYKVMEYSIFRAAKEILYIPFSFEVRFRAKELIDVFGHRSGQGIASTLYKFVQSFISLGKIHTPYLMGAILGLWLIILIPLRTKEKNNPR